MENIPPPPPDDPFDIEEVPPPPPEEEFRPPSPVEETPPPPPVELEEGEIAPSASATPEPAAAVSLDRLQAILAEWNIWRTAVCPEPDVGAEAEVSGDVWAEDEEQFLEQATAGTPSPVLGRSPPSPEVPVEPLAATTAVFSPHASPGDAGVEPLAASPSGSTSTDYSPNPSVERDVAQEAWDALEDFYFTMTDRAIRRSVVTRAVCEATYDFCCVQGRVLVEYSQSIRIRPSITLLGVPQRDILPIQVEDGDLEFEASQSWFTDAEHRALDAFLRRRYGI